MARIENVLQLVGQLNYVWTNTESLFIYLIAYLAGTRKEAAIVIFLTLNTTRARLDLLERLAKTTGVTPDTRAAVLDLAGRLQREARVRNKYNHCIYSFDANGELNSTQLMRIADFNDELKYGKVEALDDDEMERIRAAIAAITVANRDILTFMTARDIAV
ncbi:MAG: hypothetical protein KJ944_04620 [Alphaproteobacteria bacterium]|nr:hypothetical protein [Alphaproteobacteria bacterium]MBU1561122.1 hypothetical protein [Alphaproteobacteria bacterium]MBU2301862.1 hypothetical protein [Alphaproteobacteria bacterium]MBU2368722.1 hypothetical protein [Alphaproteobacteria bacterium]